jgi:structural maintenance of chromosome 3 (chondroitin sulfate proteoglycan 6)
LKAVELVLLEENSQIRSQEKLSFINERSSVCSVEIIFDNSSRSIPIDSDEISFKRGMSLKKDEYFIDKRKSTHSDLKNLLESSGFSLKNGYYIVH